MNVFENVFESIGNRYPWSMHVNNAILDIRFITKRYGLEFPGDVMKINVQSRIKKMG